MRKSWGRGRRRGGQARSGSIKGQAKSGPQVSRRWAAANPGLAKEKRGAALRKKSRVNFPGARRFPLAPRDLPSASRSLKSWREKETKKKNTNLTGLAAKRSGRNQSAGGGRGGGLGEDWHFSSGSAAAWQAGKGRATFLGPLQRRRSVSADPGRAGCGSATIGGQASLRKIKPFEEKSARLDGSVVKQ